MAATQKVKEAEITEQDSLPLTRNPTEMKITKLMSIDAESKRLIDWMEKGVYDALQKKFLKTLLFCVCEGVEGPMIEEYAFSFSYSDSESQEVSMNINRIGNTKQGATFKTNFTQDISPNQMRSSACKMVETLVQLMRTLDRMPEERTILMKLLYYEDVTPIDYEPPFFRCCSEQEAYNTWTKNPLKMEVGNVNSKHFELALKVKSILDPCEDENEDIQEGEDVSLGADSAQMDGSSDSKSEVNHSQREDQYFVAPAAKRKASVDNDMVDEDNTKDEEYENQMIRTRVRQWIDSHHIDTFELIDVLSNFPDISVTSTEGEWKTLSVLKGLNDMIKKRNIMLKLVEEGILSRADRNVYKISKGKALSPDIDAVKEEMDVQENVIVDNWDTRMDWDTRVDEDYMYMKKKEALGQWKLVVQQEEFDKEDFDGDFFEAILQLLAHGINVREIIQVQNQGFNSYKEIMKLNEILTGVEGLYEDKLHVICESPLISKSVVEICKQKPVAEVVGMEDLDEFDFDELSDAGRIHGTTVVVAAGKTQILMGADGRVVSARGRVLKTNKSVKVFKLGNLIVGRAGYVGQAKLVCAQLQDYLNYKEEKARKAKKPPLKPLLPRGLLELVETSLLYLEEKGKKMKFPFVRECFSLMAAGFDGREEPLIATVSTNNKKRMAIVRDHERYHCLSGNAKSRETCLNFLSLHYTEELDDQAKWVSDTYCVVVDAIRAAGQDDKYTGGEISCSRVGSDGIIADIPDIPGPKPWIVKIAEICNNDWDQQYKV